MQEALLKYVKVFPQNKDQAAQLASSNCIVGNKFKLHFDIQKRSITVENKFGYLVGAIDEDAFSEIVLQKNKGYKIQAILKEVFFTTSGKGKHWAKFLIAAYSPRNEECFENYIENLKNKLEKGLEPDISLDEYEFNKIIESNGAWQSKKHIKKEKLPPNTAIIKNKVRFIEKIIEAGRQKKIGCYVISILFLLAVAVLIFWIIKTLVGF